MKPAGTKSAWKAACEYVDKQREKRAKKALKEARKLKEDI